MIVTDQDIVEICELLDLDKPVPAELLNISVGAISGIASFVTFVSMPGATPEHVARVMHGLTQKYVVPQPGQPKTIRTFRKNIAAFLRDLAERMEPIE